MATVKHIAIHNSSYSAATDYLTMQYNEFTNKPVFGPDGEMLPRDFYLIDGINCDPYTFAAECQNTNAFFKQNQNYEDIKAHHYIVSFDPNDRDENGLTPEKAQEIGLEVAQKMFPGHQTIVCTHRDGHNGAGNIHCHIVINSVRAKDTEKRQDQERSYDNIAGYKHRDSVKFLREFKSSVMELCQREGLYQVDLLSPAHVRITDREYWAQRRGQAKLDQENATKAAAELESLLAATHEDYMAKKEVHAKTTADFKEAKEILEYTKQRHANKKVYLEFMNSKKKAKFLAEHESEIILYESATRELKKILKGNPVPAEKKTIAKIRELSARKNEEYEELSEIKKREKSLQEKVINVRSIYEPHRDTRKRERDAL